MITDDVQQMIRDHLLGEGLDVDSASALCRIIVAHCLKWNVEDLRDPDEANSILAFSFGNRIAPNGNRTPGPINDMLASIVTRHYRRKPRPVYAQWEIAETAIADGVSTEPIYPFRTTDSTS